ncbi:MAG: ABC transporter ATP-binding protein [Xanthomonadales bacterium]|jgi:lipopolysaccharide transport system ATP-binding protein|nr:ABC transporter ATP-binding protein [Xanthomonadales bacterium]MDH3924564.1 ABC transporter ATP-binding protein [Xanthomonadales bacterium]MDH3942307.1 ABC transporter ATP-binding protein [Xanthomonadales bacterium]MDH4002253.1 ABC transporter ATP-binding protein [Xanthomonadales bacterium]
MSFDKPAIVAEGLGKSYWVGGHKLIDSMGMHALVDRALTSPGRVVTRLIGQKKPTSHYPEIPGHMKWALRNVSFSLEWGEVLGIVGHNGAGKSVLLKLLSRITRPTEGHAILRGRVGSMLEAGTSFHGELTGRENIQLSGAILGMRRSEINRRMDEIIEFSQVEEYIDTPVKRYSTGMVLRLGFSVAAHLDTDIMLIDEVLAVGDQQFKRRCIDKMRSVAKSGKTVLFVSHDMDVLKDISDRAILIREGSLVMKGSPEDVVEEHLKNAGRS